MRIAFDHQAFCLQKTGGISRYFFHMAQQLTQHQQTVGVFSPLYRNQYARQLQQNTVHGFYVKDYPPRCANIVVGLCGVLARGQMRTWRPDVVHETYFSDERSGGTNIPTVLTVFDMIGELGLDGAAPSQSSIKSSRKYAAVARADHVICISEQTRQDLIKLYDIAPEKTSTVYLGCETGTDIVNIHSVTQRPFLLYVGLRSGYKNFHRFLEAVSSCKPLKDSFDIVAFGDVPFTDSERALIQSLKFVPNQVRHMTGNDRALAGAYSAATAFVYPSLYEGFGLPPLEAMAYACPVVSSQTSAMPEVIGDAAEFFDPLHIESIAQAIQRVVFSPSRTAALVQSGAERVRQFTWRKCAEQHINLYSSLIGSAGSLP